MGLSIRSYKNIKKTDFFIDEGGDIVNQQNELQEDAFSCHILADFKNYAEALESDAIYGYESYESYWIGTCTSYNDWRNQLAKMVGYQPFETDYDTWRDTLAKECGYESWEAWKASKSKSPLHSLILENPDINDMNRTPYLAGAWKAETGPHWHILNFTDNESSIDHVTAKIIANDLEKYEEQAKQMGKDFYDKYNDIKLAFLHASENGAIEFA